MDILFYILAGVLVIVHLLPMINDQHWIYRACDFGRIQIFILQLVAIILGYVIMDDRAVVVLITLVLLVLLALHNVWILMPYTPLYRVDKYDIVDQHSDTITILSSNVLQFNKKFDKLIRLIREIDPDIVLTMESNKDWEEALSVIEKDYPNYKKVPFENCYGMHFFTRLETQNIQAHFFVADDLPSIEASLTTKDGHRFTFFGVHPPPPSPTEEENSKERDGDLMCIAKRIKEIEQPVIAVGDFNNVAWARASKLFRKTSGLIDPRIGTGFVPTFHVEYPLFRFPIDLLFHSEEVFIQELRTEESIGSDHFPVVCRFFINLDSNEQENVKDTLEGDEEEEVEEMIEEGKEEESNRKRRD